MTTIKQSVAFPEVAVIRKGSKKVERNGKLTVGPDLNNRFRVDFTPGTDDKKEVFLAAYKTLEPPMIRAFVPTRSVWDAFSTFNEAHNAGRMIAQADDEHYIVLRDPLNGQYEVRNGEPHKEYKPGDVIGYDRNGKHYDLKLKPVSRLRLFLPEMVSVGQLVQFLLKTTSYYDRQNIMAHLAGIQMIADAISGGNAAGIPFFVYRKEQEITWNKPDGNAARVKKWLIQIQPDPEWVRAAYARMSKFALTGENVAGLLEPLNIEGADDPDDEEEIEGEVTELEHVTELGIGEGEPPIKQKPERPYSAEVVKEKVAERVEYHLKRKTLATVTDRKVLASILDGILIDVTKRYELCNWLVGQSSTQKMKQADVNALLDWLGAERAFNATPADHVVAEIHAAHTAALKASGQQELFQEGA